MSVQAIKDEIAKIEQAIETVDPGAKATIENATASIKAKVDAIADTVSARAESAKEFADQVLGAPTS
jgi:ABC-type Zn uptake system ZnuABC Zn-binding protein ZnuA